LKEAKLPDQDRQDASPDLADLQAYYESLPEGVKAKAKYRKKVLSEVLAHERSGLTRFFAVGQVALMHDIGDRTIWNWFKLVKGHPQADWLYLLARKLTKECAEAGYTKAMTWMSQMENSGLGGDYNPDASAEWDRKAAAVGDPVGKFNHGLNLMHGHGIAQDQTLGRKFVDEAARDGLAIAKRLQEADYDLNEVTPDADNWKYAPLF